MKRATDVPRLSKEVVLQAEKLSDPEARFLVATYYEMQDMRKRADMQIRHLGDKELPALLKYTADSSALIESQLTRAFKTYAQAHPIGRWLLSIDGIGPVIAAGLLAHLAMRHPASAAEAAEAGVAPGEPVRTETVGHWWRFAGLDPSVKWLPNKKRPWNAQLKQICWYAGQSFKKVSYKDEAFYGQLYQARKQAVVERNESGAFAERARSFKTNSPEVKKTLATGKLPAGNLDSQACRAVVKIMLSHLHALWYWHEFGAPPPKPFAISVLGHAHEIRVPNSEMFEGFDAAYYGAGPAGIRGKGVAASSNGRKRRAA